MGKEDREWLIPVEWDSDGGSSTDESEQKERFNQKLDTLTREVKANRSGHEDRVVATTVVQEMQQRFKRQAVGLQRTWPVPWWKAEHKADITEITQDNAIQWPRLQLSTE